MRKKFYLLFGLLAGIIFLNSCKAQTCSDCRYLSSVFDSVTVETVHFGQGTTADGDTQQLYMDIYQPYGDTVTNRPLMIFAFGGAFVQGARDDWYVVEICRLFAQAGYVSAAIDYRLGITANEIISLQFMRIFFRPMQDMRASVQYFKADFAESGNTYRIDTSRIIIGGASSGGITALMTAYCESDTEMAEMGNLSALDALGGFYSSSGTHQNYSAKAAATVNVAGAMINADWIEAGDVPIISAHGDADQVVPYSDGAGSINLIGFDLQGSYLVDSIARTKGVCSYLYTMVGQDHPNEDMGIDYIKSVVNRIMIRMHAVVNNRSFCCQLSADIQPGDTLYYGPGSSPATLSAQITNGIGNAQLQWCGLPCQFQSNAATVTFQPDSQLAFVEVVAHENQCQAGDLYILMDSAALTTGITAVNGEVPFSVFPNPVSNTVQVRFTLQQEGIVSVSAKNVLGQQVYLSSQQFIPGGAYLHQAALDNLQAGMYVMELTVDGKVVAAQKIMKQ